jgi:enoyl-CoA hydratase
MGNQFVNVNQDEQVATVTLNNPPANALSSPLMAELGGLLDELAENTSVKAVVIAGSGTIFVAGADIKEIATITASKQGEELTSKGQAIFNKMERLSKPTIAAINGFCLGGGLELAMACHMRICGDRARLGQPEINLGIIPGFGGTQRLSRLVGRAKALEMILTGDIINAQEAKSLGLVNKVVPEGEVLKQALGLAKKITSKGGKALSAALRAVQEGFSKPIEEGLALESRLFGTLCETADMKEGISAFLEKRQPKFKDQ